MTKIKFFVEKWIEKKKPFISSNTFLSYKRALRIIEGSAALNVSVHKLSTYNFEIFMEEINSLYNPATLKICNVALTNGLNIAKEYGDIKEVPYWKVAGVSSKEKSVLSKEETGVFFVFVRYLS